MRRKSSNVPKRKACPLRSGSEEMREYLRVCEYCGRRQKKKPHRGRRSRKRKKLRQQRNFLCHMRR